MNEIVAHPHFWLFAIVFGSFIGATINALFHRAGGRHW